MSNKKTSKRRDPVFIGRVGAVIAVLAGSLLSTIALISDSTARGQSDLIAWLFCLPVSFVQSVLLTPIAIALGSLMSKLSLRLALKYGWIYSPLFPTAGGVLGGTILVIAVYLALKLLLIGG